MEDTKQEPTRPQEHSDLDIATADDFDLDELPTLGEDETTDESDELEEVPEVVKEWVIERFGRTLAELERDVEQDLSAAEAHRDALSTRSATKQELRRISWKNRSNAEKRRQAVIEIALQRAKETGQAKLSLDPHKLSEDYMSQGKRCIRNYCRHLANEWDSLSYQKPGDVSDHQESKRLQVDAEALAEEYPLEDLPYNPLE